MNNHEHEKEMMNPEEFLTTGQASRILNVAQGTLQNWRSLGIGPKFVKHRRNVFYLRSEIERYQKEHFQMYSSTAEWKDQKEYQQ